MFDALAPQFAAAGRVALVGSGLHPGLPAAVIRAAAALRPVRSAEAGLIVDLDWSAGFTDDAAKEFTAELANMKAGRLAGGQWQTYSWLSSKSVTKVNFGPLGRRSCAWLELEELRRLPGVLPDIQDAGLAMAGFSPLADYVAMPLALAMVSLSSRLAGPASKFLVWAVRKGSKPPYRTLLQVRLEGGGEAWEVTVAHPDSYWLTSAVVAATARQIVQGKVAPGVYPAALGVDPAQLLADLESLGAAVTGL